MDSTERQLSREVSDTVSELLEHVDLVARNLEIIWDDRRVFSIEDCIEHIHKLFADFPPSSSKPTCSHSSNAASSKRASPRLR